MVPLQKKQSTGSFTERIKLLAARSSGKWGMTVLMDFFGGNENVL